LIGDADQALATLRALKSQGVKIALDDFGTGYSSLSYLRRFPFDRLKIDRSFVAELGVNDEAGSIVRCVIAMAQSLRLAVTAEGVETAGQLAMLRTMRCGHLQGFLLGRPALRPRCPAKRNLNSWRLESKQRPGALPLDPAGAYRPQTPFTRLSRGATHDAPGLFPITSQSG